MPPKQQPLDVKGQAVQLPTKVAPPSKPKSVSKPVEVTARKSIIAPEKIAANTIRVDHEEEEEIEAGFEDMDELEEEEITSGEDGEAWAGMLEEGQETGSSEEEGEGYEGEGEEEGTEEYEGSSEEQSSSAVSSDEFHFHEHLSEDSLDYDERRYLIDTHSFLHLKDPGLENALLLEEKPPEKIYKGLRADKHNYKKLCDELGIRPLKAFLEHLDSEVMDLRNYGLNDKEILAISKILCHNKYVEKLLLSGNFAGQLGGDGLAEMIENNKIIAYLDIGGTMILPSMKNICEAIQKNDVLLSIDFSMDELGDKEMSFITGFLMDNVTIRELFLQHNKITDTGLGFLAKGINTKARNKKGIKANETLEKLDLGWNRIKGGQMAGPFFEAAATHPNINWINFAGNSIDNPRGVGRVLGGTLNLEFMNVSFNRMKDTACPIIGKNLAYPKSPNLTQFVAGPNLWRQKEASKLILPLSSTKSTVPLEIVDMSLGMCVSKKWLKSKRKVSKVKPNLEIINAGNPYGLPKAKSPNPQIVTIKRAKTVCENFATPLEMLIDELRTEPASMTQDEFKKFIKSCNLYKDKVLTETFFQYFPKGSFEVDCAAIIEVYDQVFPKPKAADTGAKKTSLDLNAELALETETDALQVETS